MARSIRPMALALIRRGREILVEGYLTTVENLFTYEGEPGHEIALVYECRLGDCRIYALDAWEAVESTDGGSVPHKLAWVHPDAFLSGGAILYPEGIVALVAGRD